MPHHIASWRWLAAIVLLLAAACSREDPAAVKVEATARGDVLVEKKQYEAAARAYRRALVADPSDGDVRFKLSEAYQQAQQWGPAATEAIRAADLLPHRLDVQLIAARRMTSTGRFTDGKERIAQVLDKEPNNVDALLIWANATARLLNPTWALFRLTDARTLEEFERIRNQLRPLGPRADDDAAETAFRKAIALAPRSTESRVALVNFLWAAGRLDHSEEPLRALADELPSNAMLNQALGRLYLLQAQPADAERYLLNAARTGVYGKSARLLLADVYLLSGRDREAVSTLAEAHPEDDESGEVSQRLSLAEFRLGRRTEALQRIDRLLERRPTDAEGQRLKVEFLLDAGRISEALPLARAAVTASPFSTEARATLGQALLASGDEENAFKEYMEATRINPNAPHLFVELTRVSLARGRGTDAVLFARDAVRRFPDDRDVRLLLVQALIQTREYAGAEKELRSLLARDPQWAPGLVQLGAFNVARGNVAAARAAFTRALTSEAALLDAVSGLVSLELAQKRVAAAREVTQKALSARPDDPAYLLLAARVSEAGGDMSRAEATVRRALDIDAHHSDAMVFLGELLSRQRRTDEAIAILQQAASARPHAVEVQTNLASLLEQAGRHAEARARYEQILLQAPRTSTAAFRLATLNVHDGRDLNRALELAMALRQEQSDDAAVNDLIGSIHTKRNSPGQALPYFEQAVRTNPDAAVYRYHLGIGYLKTGDAVRGRRELRRALEMDPTLPEAAEARAALGL